MAKAVVEASVAKAVVEAQVVVLPKLGSYRETARRLRAERRK